MKILPDWFPVAVVVVLGCLLGWAVIAYGEKQFDRGEQAANAAWQKRDNEELVAANARIIELTAEARQRKLEHAADLAKASATYQENLQHEKASRDRTIADLQSGALRLRIELARRKSTGGGTDPEGNPGAGRCDAEAYGELSPAAAGFLVALTTEADDVVHQLTAAQAVIAACEKLTHREEEK